MEASLRQERLQQRKIQADRRRRTETLGNRLRGDLVRLNGSIVVHQNDPVGRQQIAQGVQARDGAVVQHETRPVRHERKAFFRVPATPAPQLA